MYYAVYVKTILSCIEIPKGLYKFIMLCTSKQYFLALKYLREGRIERGGEVVTETRLMQLNRN